MDDRLRRTLNRGAGQLRARRAKLA